MKKILGIVVLGLLWCNVSFADESELNIEIKKAVQETEPIKINEEYSLNCVVDDGEFNFEFNQKVIKSNLKTEATMSFGEDGEIYFNLKQKINSSGKLSKGNFKIHYSPDFDKDLKKEMKKYLGMFEKTIEDFGVHGIYGKSLVPIQIEDKKLAKKMLSLMKKVFASDAEMKNVLKKLKIKVYSHYLGTANIQSEKFYILKIYMVMEHPDENFLDEIDEMSFTMYGLIHVTSGYSIQMDGESYPVCTIYKQDKELVKIDTYDIF